MSSQDERDEQQFFNDRRDKFEKSGFSVLDLMPPEMQFLWQVKAKDTQEAYDYMYAAYRSGVKTYDGLMAEYKKLNETRAKRDEAFNKNFHNKD